MTEFSGNAKFHEDLHPALEENLSLFPIQLEAELNFVIVKYHCFNTRLANIQHLRNRIAFQVAEKSLAKLVKKI